MNIIVIDHPLDVQGLRAALGEEMRGDQIVGLSANPGESAGRFVRGLSRGCADWDAVVEMR